MGVARVRGVVHSAASWKSSNPSPSTSRSATAASTSPRAASSTWPARRSSSSRSCPASQDGTWVLLDLRSLDFIDSSGLRVVVGAHRAAEERGGRFTCVRGAPGSTVHRIVEIAGIDGVIEMVDDPSAATPR